MTPPSNPDIIYVENDFMHTTTAAEKLTNGDKVKVQYIESDGSEGENPRKGTNVPHREKIGTVKKTVESNGTVFVEFTEGLGEMTWKFHPVPGGTITGTHPFGNRSVRQGVNGQLKPINKGK